MPSQSFDRRGLFARRRWRQLGLSVVLVPAALIAGCGSDDSSGSSEGSGTSAEQPARQYSEDPDGDEDPRREEYVDEDTANAYRDEAISNDEEINNRALAGLCESYGIPIYSELLRNDYLGGFRYITCGATSAAECEGIKSQSDGDLDCHVEPALKRYAADCKANTEQLATSVTDAKDIDGRSSYHCVPAR